MKLPPTTYDGEDVYCVPWAIAALYGDDLGDVMRACKETLPYAAGGTVRGVDGADIPLVLSHLGRVVRPVWCDLRLDVMAAVSRTCPKTTLLCTTRDHALILRNGRARDNGGDWPSWRAVGRCAVRVRDVIHDASADVRIPVLSQSRLVCLMLLRGEHANRHIAAAVRERVPGARTTADTVAQYRAMMRKGTGPFSADGLGVYHA